MLRQEWRRLKGQFADMGIELPNVDTVANSKKPLPPEVEKELIKLLKIRAIQSELMNGVHYISPKATRGGQMAVRKSAERIKEIFDAGLEKLKVDKTYDRLMEWAKGHDPLEYIRRLEQAVYDREFSHWAGGVMAYEREIAELAEALEVEDIWAGLW